MAVALLMAGVSRPAHAFVQNRESQLGSRMRWNISAYDGFLGPDQNPGTLAIRYRIGLEGSGQGSPAVEADAIRAAFGQWQAVAGTRLKFEEMPGIPNASAVVQDGMNSVTWASAGQNPYINSGTLARTTLVVADTGDILEADIVINRGLPWNADLTVPSTGGYLLEGVILHEIGHLLGLLHSPLGGATLFYKILQGSAVAAGLSSDEISAVRALYGDTTFAKTLGSIWGRVTLAGKAVFGAAVVAESPPGMTVAATLSELDGSYELAALPPGSYVVRAVPLDPSGNADAYLVRGYDIDEYDSHRFGTALTGFKPAPDTNVVVVANRPSTNNFSVGAGAPAFRITEIRNGLDATTRASDDVALQLPAGRTSVVGVYVPGFSGTVAELRIGGDGLSFGATEVIPNALRSLTLIQAPVAVAESAAPGLRSIRVTAGGEAAWAHGFVEVMGPWPDFNFDGLDDLFQRKYFRPFTRPEAAPGADPDGDGWTNQREQQMGSNPTDPASANFKILSVSLNASGVTTVLSQAAPGRKFQLFRRSDVGVGSWETVGAPQKATAETLAFVDSVPAVRFRAYRVRQVP